MFSLRHYEPVANAYLRGLEKCIRPEHVASVASFFLSRVDTMADHELEKIGTNEALGLRGRIAIANAKLAYQRFREIFYGGDFSAQRKRGARAQRTLWASTSTKNPQYHDVLYVEELIGPEVNTMPLATIEGFRDHGRVRGDTVMEDIGEARKDLDSIARLGIDSNVIAGKLQNDGIAAFAGDYDRVLGAIGKKQQMAASGQLARK